MSFTLLAQTSKCILKCGSQVGSRLPPLQCWADGTSLCGGEFPMAESIYSKHLPWDQSKLWCREEDRKGGSLFSVMNASWEGLFKFGPALFHLVNQTLHIKASSFNVTGVPGQTRRGEQRPRPPRTWPYPSSNGPRVLRPCSFHIYKM